MNLYSIQAEENIISALLMNKVGILEEIKLDYFYDKDNRTILKAIMDLDSKGIGIDYANISKQLEQNKADSSAILKVPDIIGNTLHAELEGNIKLLRDLYKRRIAIDTLEKGVYQISNIDNSIDSITATIAEKIDQITYDDEPSNDDTHNTTKRLEKDLKSAVNKEEIEKYKYGIPQLDSWTWGLHKEELTTVAAKSGVGKTAFALQVASRLLINGLKVLIVSREMSDVQILKRILVSYTGIDSNKFRSRTFTKKEWEIVNENIRAIRDFMDLYINTEISTVTAIKKRIRQIKPDVVIIDYLQLLTPEKSMNNREREVATISREIKGITSDFKIPIIQLSQLNDSFGDSRPQGERAMRESKAIYQDSNNVIYIHKPNEKEFDSHMKKGKISVEQYIRITDQGNDIVEIILDKQRDGMTGSFLQQYVKNKLRFQSLEEGQ